MNFRRGLIPVPNPQFVSRAKFSPAEDARLRNIVLAMRKVNWRVVAQIMGNRSPRQCRERFKNYLEPSLRTADWTAEEDALLLEKFAELGPKWSQMTAFFNRRSGVSLKNHYAKISQRMPLRIDRRIHRDEEEDDDEEEEEEDATEVSLVAAPKEADSVADDWLN
jgi:hypothetical protein